MTARTIPTLPTWAAGQRVLASNMASMVAYQQFWADPPMFRMYQSVAQSVNSSLNSQITMDTLDYDTDSGRGLSSPWSYTIPSGMTGRWSFGTMISWSGNATGVRISEIYKNGTIITGAQESVPAAPATNSTNCFVSVTTSVIAGDVIAAYGWQQSGSALNTNTANGFPSFFEGRLISLANP